MSTHTQRRKRQVERNNSSLAYVAKTYNTARMWTPQMKSIHLRNYINLYHSWTTQRVTSIIDINNLKTTDENNRQ